MLNARANRSVRNSNKLLKLCPACIAHATVSYCLAINITTTNKSKPFLSNYLVKIAFVNMN